MAQHCSACGARLARDQRDNLCSPCAHRRNVAKNPSSHGADFWHRDDLRDALAAQHFGQVVLAYRSAHTPPLTQATIGRWLSITQAQVSRMERATAPPSDLRKLQRWAAALRIPADLLWFAASHTTAPHTTHVSAAPDGKASLEGVHRRDLLKLTGAAVMASSDLLTDAPWQRLADSLAGHRPADTTTVSMIENRTAEFFRSEETLPARQLVTSLREHHRALRGLISTTTNDSLRQRLLTCLGETEALAGWTLFDLQRPRDAVRLYRNALTTARDAGDKPLAACVLGYWSYLPSGNGDLPSAVRMLDDATEQVRGSSATTQAWISARHAEEQASLGDHTAALKALDRAVTVFDYATPGAERPWTCFFTPSRLGSLAVSTYGRMAHPDTDHAATTLLASLAPTENKVKALVLADLATSAARSGDYDHVQSLSDHSAQLAVRTEASLAIDRLWDLVEVLPEAPSGTAGQVRKQLAERLLAR